MPNSSGPVLQWIASALQLWVRQQCNQVEELEIRLMGSALALLRGQLAGVQLVARQVDYQGLQLERVELRSAALQVQLGPLGRGPSLRLERAFGIEGLVGFSAKGLRRSLARPEWRPLAEGLGAALLGGAPLTGFRIEADHLVLSGPAPEGEPPIERRVRIEASGGSLAFHPLDGGSPMHLPMDPAIRIDRADLAAGLLVLEGEALITP